MALRLTPPGEDPQGGTRAVAIQPGGDWREPFGAPPGEDGLRRALRASTDQATPAADQIENAAQQLTAQPPEAIGSESGPEPIDFLGLLQQAESQSENGAANARRAWTQAYRAFHNQHHSGSKYDKPEWRGRSKLFIPKTRAAVRKDMAAVAASLFNNIDAINCLPGNESDPKQKAAAAIMEELVNYRTDRNSGKAALPWFLVSMGARQDAVLTGVCCSKQYWKTEYRKSGVEIVKDVNPETGEEELVQRDVYKLDIDRPDSILIPPENYTIDDSADWTNPVQSAAFFIVKWPMQLDEIKSKQKAPVNPWLDVSEDALKSASEGGKQDAPGIRRAREMGHDRMGDNAGRQFQIIWVSEVFMRVNGEDYTWYSLGSKAYLTNPKPTREVYPEQYGERPITLGYANLESHRIYPMSPAESWQPLQREGNELRNLMLDATKQNVMPISKVVRGRQIDLDQVRRRSSGSSIIVSSKDDVTWETPPQMPQTAVVMSRELSIELDDLAGQQNYGNVEQSNALGKTLGGLKLAAGAANAVQEFDIRLWLETWTTPTLSQIVRLEQYYESDAIVLGLCGQRAQLFEKHGIDTIDDELLEQEITVRVSAGLGAGDPQQRLAKFQTAAQIVGPVLQQSPAFQSGQKELNVDAVCEEVFGAAGYKDGGARFFKDNGQPRANPMADLKTQEIQAKIEKDKQTGKAAMFNGLAALAKAALGKRELEASVVDSLLGQQRDARDMGFTHGHMHNQSTLAALDHGHRHGLAIANHRASRDDAARAAEQAAPDATAGEGAGMDGAPVADEAAPAPSGAAPPEQSPASSPPSSQMLLDLLAKGEIDFVRDGHGRISGIRLKPNQAPLPAA